MASWVVPGCALEGGRGWKVWLSREGMGGFAPGRVTVTNAAGQPQAHTVDWQLREPLKGLDRRIGIATITLNSPNPGEPYLLDFADHRHRLRLRSLPDTLTRPVTFLFSSCFYQPADPNGRYHRGVQAIPPDWAPAFKLLLGDQLYCDWPPEADTLKVIAKQAYEVYGYRYGSYWGDPNYRKLFGESPNFFLGEDHEYWNDYPETSWRHLRSHSGYRDLFQEAADAYYQAFQLCNNPGADRWYRFQMGPVSFFGADIRTERELLQGPDSRFMSQDQWAALEAWVRELTGPGIVVMGQALLQGPGKKGGRTLANYTRDNERLWTLIERAQRGKGADGRPHDILILAGDIHTSRYSEASCNGLMVREFIASPVSKICPDRVTPDRPPKEILVGEGAGKRIWKVQEPEQPTLDSTVGLVRLSGGEGNRVIAELALWRLQPYPLTSFGQEALRCLGKKLPEDEFKFLFRRTVELR